MSGLDRAAQHRAVIGDDDLQFPLAAVNIDASPCPDSVPADVGQGLLAASGIFGNGHHGLRGTFADIAWFAFLLSALTLVLAGITALARSRIGNGHESKPGS